ncbi:hypothetical protein ONZ45_g16446 [Pleurotus djamor]|nr:hypothetical protein ONZ45_g16446 [Pleurotus djamor]
MKYLDDKGVQGLLTLSGIKQSRPTIYEHFVEACVKNNGGVIDENEDQVTRRLNSVVQFIATGFPEPHKASEDLHAFAKLNEGRLYKLLKTCMDPSTDLKGLVKTTNEFVRRMEQASPSLMNTMSSFLYRCSLRIFNQSSIPSLIKAIQRDHGKTTLQTQVHAAHSLTLMTSISKHFPILYKPHIPELSKAIASEKSEKLVEASLQALAAAARFDEKLAPLDKRTIERVSRYALGDNRRHAKFAARLLAFTKDKDSTCATVIESVVSGLDEATDDTLVARLAVLVQFARYAPESFERHSEVITTSVLQGLLMIPTPATPPDAMDVDEDPEEEWAEEDALSSVIKAKILALKMFRYRCLAHAQDEDPLEVATPVLKMLVTILDQNGSLPGGQDEDPKLLSRLRLEAATSLIHLSCIGVYLASLAPRFVRLVLTIQDTCYNVRHIFITKVVALLSSRKLPARFSVIPFMTIHDPETDVRFIASSYVSGALKRMTPALRFEHFEYIIIRLLHVLAHHPDFSTSANDLLDMAKYIQSYLDLVANADNISLINTLAAKGKTVRDPESHTHSENLYALSELAQELIKHHARQRSWGITSYPGKLKLPGDILKPLPSAEAANTVLKTVYLPEGAIDWLNDLGKPKQSGKDREKKEKSTVKRKASASKSNGHATKRSKKRKQTDDDDDDDDDDDSSPVTEDEDDFGNPLSSKREESPLSSLGESEDEDESKGNEEDLGRGARSRAKARARRRAKHGPEKS